MANPFDQLDGYQLDGFFSKVTKAIKKVHKVATAPAKKISQKIIKPVVVKVVPKSYVGNVSRLLSPDPVYAAKGVIATTRQIEKKILPQKVLEIKAKIENDPIVRAAVLAVISMIATPMVGAALAKVGLVAQSAVPAITTKTIAQAAAKGAAQALVKKHVTKKITQDALNKLPPIVTEAGAANAAKLIAELQADPAFNKTVVSLAQKGMKIPDIIAELTKSKNFENIAVALGYDVVYGEVYKQYIDAGLTAPDAQIMAQTTSLDVAQKAANTAAGKPDLAKIAMIGIPLAFALIGG